MESYAAKVRRFNRFYVAHIGLINQNYFESDLSFTEVRLLYEIGERDNATAQFLSDKLHLDKGYLSRTIKSLIKKDLLRKEQSENDARTYFLCLTAGAQRLLNEAHRKVENQIANMTAHLHADDKVLLVQCMETIQYLLNK